MTATFNANRHGQLLEILAQGGFVGEYVELCQRYKKTNYAHERTKLDFAGLVAIFKARDPSAKPHKRWRMIEFGRENIGGWTWAGSLVVKKYDVLDPMMEGVTEDDSESVGSNWISLAGKARLLLPEGKQASSEDYGRPHYDGSMQTVERIVADLVAMFDHMKAMIRRGWGNADPVGSPGQEQIA